MSKEEIVQTRRKLLKAGLATAGGVGLLSLLKKEALACGTCNPGCEKGCRNAVNGGPEEPA